MGVYTKPSRLRLATTLIFPEQEMALAFWEGLRKTGKPRSLFRICEREVSVRMHFSEDHGLIPGICRSVVLLWNRLLCRGFRIVTYPWKRTADRMVFLYYLLPGWFRKILVLSGGRCKPRCRTRKPHGSCRGR